MKLSNSRRYAYALSLPCYATALLFAAICASATRAEPLLPAEAPPYNPRANVHWGGALERSFAYHRHGGQPTPSSIVTAPYRYGFPVSSHRWGWFGASRYYPTVIWHRGFNGDHKRWAYRHGY